MKTCSVGVISSIISHKLGYNLQPKTRWSGRCHCKHLLLSNLDLTVGDEWFTVITVPQPVSDVVSTVTGNIHPPLYFVLLHYWIQLPWTLVRWLPCG
jgi:hypothetical protein